MSAAAAVWAFLGSMLAILGALLAGAALVTLLLEPSQSVVVFGPQDRNLSAIVAADGLIVEQGDGFTVARGTSPGLPGKLYEHGAWLVLPSLGGGCITSPFGVSRLSKPPG